MAYFDDVEKRARVSNPAVDEIFKALYKNCIKAGATGPHVTFVEGMTLGGRRDGYLLGLSEGRLFSRGCGCKGKGIPRKS